MSSEPDHELHEIRALERPRALSVRERAWLERLVSATDAERALLEAQLAELVVRAECAVAWCPTLEFDRTEPRRAGLVDPPTGKLDVEGVASDEDGVPILLDLYLLEGAISMLDVSRGDSAEIRRLPAASELEVRRG